MTFSQADFADDTAYERFVLASLGAHRIRPSARSAVFHLENRPRGGGATIEVGLAGNVGGQRLEEFKASLRALGFGAAYKTIDLLIEHVLRANGAPQSRLRFTDKVKLLENRPAILPAPFDARPDLWDRLANLYTTFEDARHAVTHRRAGGTSNGGLDVHSNAGQKTDSISADEVNAFLAAAHGAAELVIDANSDPRNLRILAWHLNELASRHGLGLLDADDPSAGVALIIADLVTLDDGRMRVDVGQLRETVERQGREVWDLELRGDGRVFSGRWEGVPDKGAESFTFDPALPPSWLTEQVAA